MHAHWWLNPRYLVSGQGTSAPMQHNPRSPQWAPWLSALRPSHTSKRPRCCSGSAPSLGFQRDPERWTARSWKSGIPSGSPQSQVQPPLMEWKWNNMLKKKEPKKDRTQKSLQKKRKLRSWLVKPTSQQKGHRRSGSFDVDVVAQVFNVVHFLMLHAQVLGSKIVDSRIGPCLKWPKYPKPATFRSSFLTFLVLCSDPT